MKKTQKKQAEVETEDDYDLEDDEDTEVSQISKKKKKGFFTSLPGITIILSNNKGKK